MAVATVVGIPRYGLVGYDEPETLYDDPETLYDVSPLAEPIATGTPLDAVVDGIASNEVLASPLVDLIEAAVEGIVSSEALGSPVALSEQLAFVDGIATSEAIGLVVATLANPVAVVEGIAAIEIVPDLRVGVFAIVDAINPIAGIGLVIAGVPIGLPPDTSYVTVVYQARLTAVTTYVPRLFSGGTP